jgi:F-type H+-transporting ATPase subunit a
VAAQEQVLDPVHQFSINRIIHIDLNGIDASFTNASLYMIIVIALISLLMIAGTSGRALVPGRIQSLAEMAYEFTANMVRTTAGTAGMRFFPFIFSIFMFVLVSNLLGLLPYTFTVTSQIVTFGLAATVMLLVILFGFYKHGVHFLKLFVPSGVPLPILIILVPIEIISFVSRVISLSVRLFANMLAGHITLQVFGFFMLALLGGGVWALLAPLPLLAAIAMFALELLVACLQAYVFAVLTSVYLNDALHPGH